MNRHRSAARRLLLCVVLLLALTAARLPAVVSQDPSIPSEEKEALVALYNSTDGPNWTYNLNWLQDDSPCSWYGITCDGGHVTAISLSFNRLLGEIPAELEDLTELERLYLYGNQLSGSIPSSLGNLGKLKRLDLSGNQLEGAIPAELGNLTELEVLRLLYNQLSGGIPSSLGSLGKLEELDLASNPLSGPLPMSLTNLPLTFFHFNDTNLCEPADPTFQQWLDGISYTERTDLCPSEIPLEELEALVALYNSTNGPNWTYNSGWLGSESPCSWYGISCSEGHVTAIDLPINQLSGEIPAELEDLTELTQLKLENNQLSGSIPPSLGNLGKLEYLCLAHNKLSGFLPAELGGLTNLDELYIYDNPLLGPLPMSLINLSLWQFYFDYTDLCEPADPTFQQWLAGITYTARTEICAMSYINLPVILRGR